ncbi:MAG: penicillin-binding protein activator [Nitrospirota bacterium]|nr:penicillin-binding protein activator [Nitrospirota bacterium]
MTFLILLALMTGVLYSLPAEAQPAHPVTAASSSTADEDSAGMEGLNGEEGTEAAPVIPDDTMLVLDAHALYEEQKLEEAAVAYREILVAFPDSIHLEAVLFRLGDSLDRLNRLPQAVPLWEKLVRRFPDHPEVPHVEGRLLTFYLEQGQLAAALDIQLKQMARAQPAEKGAALHAVALTRLALGEPDKGIRDLLRRMRHYLGPEEIPAAEEELRTLVGQLPLDELETLVERFPDPVPGAWIVERMARHHAARSDLFQTRFWTERYLTSFPDGVAAGELRQLVHDQESAVLDHRYRVGLLLHLSGEMAGYGEQVRRGAQLAYDLAMPTLPPGQVGFWVYDLDGPRPLLGGHLRKLLRQADPAVVIGPMLTSEVEEFSRTGRAVGVPLIAPLVERPDGSEQAVVGLGISPRTEGIAAARYAMAERGFRRMNMLVADTTYGHAVADAFRAEFTRLGGEVPDGFFFATDASDLRGGLQGIVRRDLKADGVAELTEEAMLEMGLSDHELELADLLPEPELPKLEEMLPEGGDAVEDGEDIPPVEDVNASVAPEPDQPFAPLQGPPLGPHPYFPGFDAVFLAGTWEQVVLAAPHLPFNDISLPIIGTRAWNDRRLIRKGGNSVRGAEFPALFFRGSNAAKAFVEAYRKAWGDDPGLFAALGYDAMNLAVRSLVNSHGEPWTALPGAFEGVTGTLRVLSDGGVERVLPVLRAGSRGFSRVGMVTPFGEMEPLAADTLPTGPVESAAGAGAGGVPAVEEVIEDLPEEAPVPLPPPAPEPSGRRGFKKIGIGQ